MNTVEYIMSKSAREDLKMLMEKIVDVKQLQNLEDNNFPQKLYKYCSINKYNIDNLLNNELTATNPVLFNDLYDSTMHFDTYAEKLKRISELNLSAKKLGYNSMVDEHQTKELLKNSEESDIFKSTFLAKGFRIVSLSSKPNDTKMWGLYANKNRGICVEYSFKQDLHKIAKFVYPVFYVDKPIEDTYLCDSDEMINLAILKSILSKAKDWEYEAEWRIVFYIGYNINDPRIQLIRIPKPTAIYLGYKLVDKYCNSKIEDIEETEYFQKLLTYVKKNKISLNICKPQMRSYALAFEDINIDDICGH